MYKKYCFFVGIVVSLFFCSCKKEEIFSPSKYIDAERKSNASNVMEIVKRFTYSEKDLTSVSLLGNITLTFEYNSDKTVSRITTSEKNNTYAQMSYKDKRITQIQYYEDNKLAREIVFGRKDGGTTINKVEKYVYDGFLAKSTLSDLLFPETKSLPEQVLKSHKSTDGKSLYSIENVTYEGDNISRVRWFFVYNGQQTLETITTYKYDEKKNPYYGLPYAFLELTGYSKNNVTSSITSYENGRDKEIQKILTLNHAYAYDKKYPVLDSITERLSYVTGFDTIAGQQIVNIETKGYTIQYGYK